MESTDKETARMLIEAAEKKCKRSGRVKAAVFLVIIIAAVGGYAWHVRRVPANNEDSSAKTATTTAKVTKGVYTTTIDLSGYVEAGQTQKLTFRVDGVVTSINKDEGDRVKKGDVLATIDDSSQQATVKSYENQLEEARLTGNQRSVELLELQLKAAEAKLDFTRLTANFDGVVASNDLELGVYGEAGDDAMTIIDDSSLKATVEIDEIDMMHVKEGMHATLSFDALPGQDVDAVVSYVPTLGEYTDEGIGVKNVELTIEDPPEGIYPGYTFSGTMTEKGETEMILLPQNAVTSRRGVTYVTRQNSDGSTEQLEVTVKYLGEGICQLTKGDLNEGDELVVSKTASASTSILSNMTGMGAGGPPPGGGMR